MKKVKSEITDELRPEYKRSDFDEFVRSTYANRIKDETNVQHVAKMSGNEKKLAELAKKVI